MEVGIAESDGFDDRHGSDGLQEILAARRDFRRQ